MNANTINGGTSLELFIEWLWQDANTVVFICALLAIIIVVRITMIDRNAKKVDAAINVTAGVSVGVMVAVFFAQLFVKMA